MATQNRSKNRASRLDPSRPKLPPSCPTVPTIAAGNLVLTASEPMQYKNPVTDDNTDALPGLAFINAGGTKTAGTVTLSVGDTIATINLTGGTVAATGGTLTLDPFIAALTSKRGGILAIGQYKF